MWQPWASPVQKRWPTIRTSDCQLGKLVCLQSLMKLASLLWCRFSLWQKLTQHNKHVRIIAHFALHLHFNGSICLSVVKESQSHQRWIAAKATVPKHRSGRVQKSNLCIHGWRCHPRPPHSWPTASQTHDLNCINYHIWNCVMKYWMGEAEGWL